MLNYLHVTETTNRHGTIVRYFKKKGQRLIRLWAEPGTKDFDQEYENAKNGVTAPRDSRTSARNPTPRSGVVITKPQDDTLRWLVTQYLGSEEFKALAYPAAEKRRRLLHAICDSHNAAVKMNRGDITFATMDSRAVEAIRDEFKFSVSKPGRPNLDPKKDVGRGKVTYSVSRANNTLRDLGVVFAWAVKAHLAAFNPVKGVDALEPVNKDGWHTWTPGEVARFRKRWAIGTKPRLWFELHYWTGCRISDVIRLGADILEGEHFDFTEKKGSGSRVIGRRRPPTKERNIWLAPELAYIIDKTPLRDASMKPVRGEALYMVNKYGRRYSVTVLDRHISEWVAAAGLPDICTSHGIRKHAATELAELGASERQLMAMFGWTNSQQASNYTKKANAKAMTRDALELKRAAQAPKAAPALRVIKGKGKG